MVDHDRREFVKIAGGAAAVTGLAGCVGGGGGGGGGDTETTTDGGGNDTGNDTGNATGDGGGSDTTNVGMVYALGGLGDNSFNDMAHQGLTQAKNEFDVESSNVEPEDATQFQTLQRRFASSTNPSYDLVCCIGFVQLDALKKTSQNFTDQNFMLVDASLERDNVASYVFKEHQGSFQVGYLAGMLTTREFSHAGGSTNGQKNVGFVGGKENPLIKKFEAGFEAGAKHADESITVQSAYAGSWSDIARGKNIALSMYDSGADVVYHAAGGTGIGVFQAAQQKNRYAIGVDADQSKSASDYADWIVASMVKHVDTAVYESIANVSKDSFEGGTVHELGLEKGGVEAVVGTEFQGSLPEEITSALEESKQKIIAGDIPVPEDPSEV